MITVIIPLYNAADTITMVLDSVRNQTAVQMIREIIIINDGSTDNSEQVVRDYIKHYPQLPITYLYQQNQGASAARNAGLSAAKSKYVAFLDADDIWMPNKIERQLQVIHENPQVRFLGTAWEEKPMRIGLKKITTLYNGTAKDLCIKNFPPPPSVLMETAIREEVGYFNPAMRYGEDVNYFQKIAAKGNYYFLPEKLIQIDIGKDYFAESGLSSNLRDMHKGAVRNILELRQEGQIPFLFWFMMRIFYQLKYYRRVIRRYICSREKTDR